jgi:nucleotide-binding universal stress UspA family protein
MGEIVVGVDGSEPSHRALRWALEEARLCRAVAVVVHAYEPVILHHPYVTADPFVPLAAFSAATVQDQRLQDEQDTRDRQRAEGVVQQALDDAGWRGRDAEVKRLTVARNAAKTLVEMSDHAELLVVGSRGRGGFTGLLLGSVSLQCLHHARCPVVIVR